MSSEYPGLTRWTPPPGWPTPPIGWEPPTGWTPPQEWPPAPEGWQWWQPMPPVRQSDFSFYLAGLGALAAALVVFYLGLWFALIVTAGCNEDLGNPAGQTVAFVLLSVMLISCPAYWTFRALRQHRAWLPWVGAMVVCALVIVNAAHWGSRYIEQGCLF